MKIRVCSKCGAPREEGVECINKCVTMCTFVNEVSDSASYSPVYGDFYEKCNPIGVIFGNYKLEYHEFQLNSIIYIYDKHLVVIDNLNTGSYDRWDIADDIAIIDRVENHIFGVIDYMMTSKKHKHYIFNYAPLPKWDMYHTVSEDTDMCAAADIYKIEYPNGEYSTKYFHAKLSTDLPNGIEGIVNVNCHILNKYVNG